MKNGLYQWASISLFFLICLSPLESPAEKVKALNQDCEVCPVVISYEGEEARTLLGGEGINLLLKLIDIKHKTSKIDLDGHRKTGSNTDSDEGYELLVYTNKNLIAINSICDMSSIQIQTDIQNLKTYGPSNLWLPEIHIRSAGFEIEKSDDLQTAWAKVKESKLYEYVTGMGGANFNENLKNIIQHILKSVTEN